MTLHAQEWIAERTLREGTGRKRVTVRLAKPYEAVASEWVSHVEMQRGRTRTTLDVRGADAFQPLILALQAIRYELDKLEQPITWEGGEPGEAGFPLYITDLFGQELTRRLETIVAAETERFVSDRKRQ